MRDLIAKNTGSKKDLVIVDTLKQEAGKRELIGYSKIYQNTESAMLYEPDYELIRNGLKQKAAGRRCPFFPWIMILEMIINYLKR